MRTMTAVGVGWAPAPGGAASAKRSCLRALRLALWVSACGDRRVAWRGLGQGAGFRGSLQSVFGCGDHYGP